MAAPSRRRNGGDGASLWAALLLAAVALRPAEAVSEPTTVAFDVRPGGVVHTFSQSVGPGDKYTCVFTYASQGGTNEKWQMSLGTSEDHQHFTCTIWRMMLQPTEPPSQGDTARFNHTCRCHPTVSVLSKQQAPGQVLPVLHTVQGRGAGCGDRVRHGLLSHRPGAFKAELSKLVIVAKASRSEL
ncbi:myeloid-derived growth factor isoform X4 [Myotis myotis]|uniref:myeloid-derived growth factor isoform X4 n=1 Tax=Myotis myotis TaxID=51298 RepID=UPI00174BBA07|nr:myeloid-derived growth factor isoform X4 [Myotis myotis]